MHQMRIRAGSHAQAFSTQSVKGHVMQVIAKAEWVAISVRQRFQRQLGAYAAYRYI